MLAISNGKSRMIFVNRTTNDKIVLRYNDEKEIWLYPRTAMAVAIEIIALCREIDAEGND